MSLRNSLYLKRGAFKLYLLNKWDIIKNVNMYYNIGYLAREEIRNYFLFNTNRYMLNLCFYSTDSVFYVSFCYQG